jgi:hypothetical protein
MNAEQAWLAVTSIYPQGVPFNVCQAYMSTYGSQGRTAIQRTGNTRRTRTVNINRRNAGRTARATTNNTASALEQRILQAIGNGRVSSEQIQKTLGIPRTKWNDTFRALVKSGRIGSERKARATRYFAQRNGSAVETHATH